MKCEGLIMKKMLEFKTQLIVILIALALVIIALWISSAHVPIAEMALYYGLFAIITTSWKSYTSPKYRSLVWGFCAWICIVVSVAIFDMVDSAVICILSGAFMVLVDGIQNFGKRND
jgi:hypothetical protein